MDLMGESIQSLGIPLSTSIRALLSDYQVIPMIIVKTSLDPGYLKSGPKYKRNKRNSLKSNTKRTHKACRI
jgi:hypothetical protein